MDGLATAPFENAPPPPPAPRDAPQLAVAPFEGGPVAPPVDNSSSGLLREIGPSLVFGGPLNPVANALSKVFRATQGEEGPQRPAATPIEYAQAGFQGSAMGLGWRGKLPELVLDPANSAWWQRAIAGISAVGSDLPIMALGSVAGAIPGTAAGGAVAGPPGAAVGSVLGAGAGMFGVPAAIRETLMQAYKEGGITTVGQFFTALQEVLKTTGKEAGIGAVTFGAGSVVARTAGKVLAPMVGESISVGTATKAIGTADVAAQILAMTTVPAALDGRLPNAQDIVDAAIVIGGLKGAHVVGTKMADVFSKTGRTPSEVVADSKTNPTVAEDLNVEPTSPRPAETPPTDRAAYINDRQYQDSLRGQYVKDGEVIASSREVPADPQLLPELGTWRIDDRAGSYGHEIAQLREVPIADLLGPELDATGNVDPVKRADVERYAEWAREGKRAPPIEVLETDRGPLSVTNGHRRLLAARAAGAETIEAWVSPAMDVPGSKRDPEGRPIRTGLTFESLQGPIEESPIYQRVLTALNQVARTSEEQNQAYAAMTAAFYNTKAARSGRTPEQLFSEHMLRVSGEPPSPGSLEMRQSPDLGLEHPEVKATLQRMVDHDEIGWAEIGGRLDIARLVKEFGPDAIDENGRPTKLGVPAFTSWVPKADWWTGRPGHPGKGLNEKGVREAIRKALAGEKLKALEKRTVDYLVGVAEDRIHASNELGPERFADIAAIEAGNDLAPTTQNVVDGDAVARAAEKDEAAVERAAMQYENDDAGFMRAIREINGEEQASAAAGTGGETGERTAAQADGQHPALAIARAIADADRRAAEGPDAAVDPDLLFQEGERGPIFYSALARQVDAAQIKSAPAQGWKDFLKGQIAKGSTKGISADEVKWSGLEEWLDLQPGKITRGQVAEFLKSNGVRVEEVPLGPPERPSVPSRPGTFDGIDTQVLRDFIDSEFSRRYEADAPDSVEEARNAVLMIEQGRRDDGVGVLEELGFPDTVLIESGAHIQRGVVEGSGDNAPTKFSQYQLPGGENYRELLLTLPDRAQAWEGTNGDGVSRAFPTEGEAESFAGEVGVVMRTTSLGAVTGGFRSSHFDTPNILAHVRFNERTDAEGKRVLFVEEIQSDWAQQGKKQGFAGPKPTMPSIPDLEQMYGAKISEAPQEIVRYQIVDEAGEPVRNRRSVFSAEQDAIDSMPAEQWAQWKHAGYTIKRWLEPRPEQWAVKWRDGSEGFYRTEADAQAALRREWSQDNEAPDTKVPAAPFVTKTDAWTGLVLKRMIRYAAENDFERIAWTRGEQQVERYTSALRKAVDEIEWKKTPEGVQLIGYKGTSTAAQPGGRNVDLPRLREAAASVITANDLLGFDTVGEANMSILQHADWADRWSDGMSQADIATINTWRTAAKRSGDSRQKVVDTTEKETALSDAIGKAMADQIISDPNQSGTITGDGIRIDDTGMAGFYDRMVPNIAKDVLKKLGGGKVKSVQMSEPLSAEELADPQTRAQALSSGIPIEQPGFDITPEMKAKALEGQPLFQRDPRKNARGYYSPDAKTIGFLENADPSTFIHESGHFYLDVSVDLARAADASADLKADMQTVFDWLGVKDASTWEAMTLDEKRPYHERWARGFEEYIAEGRAPSQQLAAAFQRFKEWLLDVYKSLQRMNTGLTPEVRRVMDRMLATDTEIAEGVPRAYAQDAVEQRTRAIVPGEKAAQVAASPFAEKLPQAEGEPALPTHVNYNRINTAEDTKLALARVSEIYEAEIQEQRRGTVSWEQTSLEAGEQLAKLLGGEPSALVLPREPGTPAAAAELLARKQMTVGAAEAMMGERDNLLAKGPDATPEDKLAFLASIERLSMIQAEFLGARAEAGRALNILKMTKMDADRARQIQDVIRVYGDDPVELARMMGELENAQGAVKFAKDVTNLTAGAGRLIEDVKAVLLNYANDPVELARQLELLELKKQVRVDPEVVKLGVKQVRDLINKYRKDPVKLAEVMAEISTPEGAAKFAAEAMRPTLWEKIIEAWKAGILSGPVTHVANIMGNGMFMALRPAIDAAAVVAGRARLASPQERVAAMEPVARVWGNLQGTVDGLRLAWHVLRTGEQLGKAEQVRGAIGTSPDSTRAAQIAGEVVRTPFRALATADALFTAMNERGEAYTLGARQASLEGLNPLTREYLERVRHLVDNPTEAMTEQIKAAGVRFTFNTPLGDKGRAVQNLVKNWHIEMIVPFIRTPSNVAQELIRMTPGAPLIGSWSNAIRRGGPERDKAIAELAVGTAVMGVVAAFAFDGTVSGAGEPDSGKKRINRAAGWQPYSVKVGDTWYSYNRLQPLGTLLGIAADMAEVWDHANEEESDKIPKMIGVAFANAITNQTFLQGITTLVQAISEPDRRIPKLAQGLAGSLVPNIIAQPTQMADPLARRVDSMLDAIRSRIPGEREKLLPKIDVWGGKQPGTDRLGGVAPINESKESEDKVKSEAMRLGLSGADAPKKTHLGRGTGKIGDVKLEPEQQNIFAEAAGKLALEIMTPIVNAPGWDNLPPLIQKRAYAKAFLMGHRAGAMAALPPEKRIAALEEIMIKIQTELTPEPGQ